MKWSTLPRGSQSSFFLCCTVVLYLAVLRVSAQDLEYYVLQCCWRYSRNSYSYSSPASLSLFRCCVLFTHLAMVHGLQGNNIHFSAAATLCQQIVPHFASQLTAQISNLLPLLLRQLFHVGQTNQLQEKEVIDKLFFFSPNFFSSHAPQERDQENLATNDEPRFLCLSHCYSRTVS